MAKGLVEAALIIDSTPQFPTYDGSSQLVLDNGAGLVLTDFVLMTLRDPGRFQRYSVDRDEWGRIQQSNLKYGV